MPSKLEGNDTAESRTCTISEASYREVAAYIADQYIAADDVLELKKVRANRRAAKAKEILGDEVLPFDVCAMPCAPAILGMAVANDDHDSLEEFLRSMDKGFAETLFDYIDAKGMTDVECYKRANIDRKTFSKIKCSESYRPSKATVLSFAIALRLTLDAPPSAQHGRHVAVTEQQV